MTAANAVSRFRPVAPKVAMTGPASCERAATMLFWICLTAGVLCEAAALTIFISLVTQGHPTKEVVWLTTISILFGLPSITAGLAIRKIFPARSRA